MQGRSVGKLPEELAFTFQDGAPDYQKGSFASTKSFDSDTKAALVEGLEEEYGKDLERQ